MTTLRQRLGVVAATGVLVGAGLAVGATAAGAATVPACGNGALAVTRTYVDSGMGSSYMTLVYRNTSAHRCSVTGYPGLDTVARHGHVLAHAGRTSNGEPVRTVIIRPGHFASAAVRWENFDGATGGSCRFGAYVNTTVANTSRVHRLDVSVSRCGLQVHPTLAGTPLYPHYGPAQLAWIRGSKAIAAEQGRYFRAAARQLHKSGDYPTQVRELKQLASFPDTGLTRKQRREARADVKDLDHFFGTPGLYR
jgi:hypothetical protein